MPADAPTILALDFDGVLCDGLLEYFQTSWRTYCQVWNPDNLIPSEDVTLSFYRLRPVIEIGWEMPILVRALMLGVPEQKISHDWLSVSQTVIEAEQLNTVDIGKKLDAVRDEWITTDLDSWLSLHRFYPGVIERLQGILCAAPVSFTQTPTQLFIVTTKEGRFVKQLLQQHGIQLPEERIIGKECKRPKSETLRQLLEAFPVQDTTLWFVEDRLKTLQSVKQQSNLEAVKLFLADWGYNTIAHHEAVGSDPRIRLLSLATFVQDFSMWL